MEESLKQILKVLKVNENLISTMMGTVVIIIMGVMVFNYFKGVNKAGQIDSNGANIEAISGTGEEKAGKEVTKGGTYKVEKGENLWKIAEKVYGSGYNYVDIVKENKLKDANAIEIGMELTMPDVPTRQPQIAKTSQSVEKVVGATESKAEAKTYTTKAGDHLWKIAVEQYKDGYAWVKIYNANKKLIGVNPSILAKNIILTLP